MRRELLDERHESQVEADVAILGVIDDVGDLLGKEPRIDGVHDGTHSGDAVIELEMPEAVPGERADAISLPDAEPSQRLGNLPSAPVHIRVRVPVNPALHSPRHDFRIAMTEEVVSP